MAIPDSVAIREVAGQRRTALLPFAGWEPQGNRSQGAVEVLRDGNSWRLRFAPLFNERRLSIAASRRPGSDVPCSRGKCPVQRGNRLPHVMCAFAACSILVRQAMPVGKFKNRPVHTHCRHRFRLFGLDVTAAKATRRIFGAGTIFACCSERSVAGIYRPQQSEKRATVDG